MNPEIRALEVLLLALVVTLAVIFQWRQFRRDVARACIPPRRSYIPLAVSGLLLVGFLVQALFSLVDPGKSGLDLSKGMEYVGKAVLFAVALNAKTLLGPVCVGFALGDTLYQGFEYGEWKFWAVMEALLDFLFDTCPRWLKYAYLVGTCIYAFLSSVVEEWMWY